MPFAKILIANRGEIACRIIRTAKRMNIATIAVYSDADRGALHVRMADEAIHIGPPAAAQSYLSMERILDAARSSGADAVHPGYGFLSENPEFAEAVEAAGLAFIGPSAGSIRAMGLKDAAKRLMEKAGVPVVPGYHGEAQELVVLATKAREIGYPVLIKARAGGGGKGMRMVASPESFADALSSCRREAKASFGDERVLVEKFIERPRHIEVQVFGDRHGNVVHLFERDCSSQRRHQKVIEEAPAPGMTAEMRNAVCTAAVKAAKAIDYCGAGTIEFIADASDGLRPDRFWFMEMNTRLQVEHPVTEMITGLDLVEWQIRVAAGESLPLRQQDVQMNGHAIEARIYAEDPEKGFLPATGKLHILQFPDRTTGSRIRIDSGVAQGDEISAYYDPMIAKLIVHADDRPTALQSIAEALSECRIAGSVTNLSFLHALATESAFIAGEVDTGLIERKREELTQGQPANETIIEQAFLIASDFQHASTLTDPWDGLKGYAHFHPLTREVRLWHKGEELTARMTQTDPDRVLLEMADRSGKVLHLDAERTALRWPGHVTIFDGPAAYHFLVPDPLTQQADSAGDDGLVAPMPGLVKLVRVKVGDAVAKAQPLLVLEAMKMEHTITAPHDGTIAEIVPEGRQISEGTMLVRFAAS